MQDKAFCIIFFYVIGLYILNFNIIKESKLEDLTGNIKKIWPPRLVITNESKLNQTFR